MGKKSELLIFAEEDLAYGIEHGYYPSISKKVELGSLSIIPLGSDHCDYNITKSPRGNGADFYILNPYSNTYIPIWDNDILNTFISDKSFAIKEALVMMGAKHIKLVESAKEKINSSSNVHNNAKIEMSDVDVDVNIEKMSSVDISSIVESHDPEREPKSFEEVREFMNNYGLIGDAKLMLLLRRLKKDGILSGSETYSVTYCSEIASALEIAAAVDCKVFNEKLDFSKKSTHVQTIDKTLEIQF